MTLVTLIPLTDSLILPLTTMKKNIIYLLIWIAVYGCYWENEEALYPVDQFCDTAFVSFSGDILPILTNNCFSCHSNSNATENAFGITLEDHVDVSASAILIIGAINHLEGFPQMPKNGVKLDTCKIQVFEAWENQGSLDN